MNRAVQIWLVIVLCLSFSAAHTAIITFDDLVEGETSFGFDGDNDGTDDVIFSTTDPSGFNTVGPGADQNFIDEPGLEGTSVLPEDLRVDFLNGANGPLSFGFALLSGIASPDFFASFSVFDASDNLVASSQVTGEFFPFGPAPGESSFPEGEVSVDFPGIAAYGTFDFTSLGSRYIIDNFEGTFGSSEEVIIPIPAAFWLFGSGLGVLGWIRREKS